MGSTTGPAPAEHRCPECPRSFTGAGALHRHVASDHRPARDGEDLVRRLLSTPPAPANSPAPGAPGPAPDPLQRFCEGLSRLPVARLGVATVVLALLLHVSGTSWSALLSASAAVVLVGATVGLMVWLHAAAAAQPAPRDPRDGGSAGTD
ncbi:C2H2-type zinc finger protein [Kineococcus sp. SYSU DK005]|uniref:C2H2-type zinc finger protein n=1 Tax=Kineococcus sp. SYSU DK005 TaxID=3383126 RepID=UPI003D7EBDB1